MKFKAIIIGLFAFAIAFTTQAQTTKTPAVSKRQVKQQKRINQGYKSGELTKRETVKLKAQQANIKRTKRRAKADGVVTKKEKAIIHHKQNKASRNIKRNKHDAQSRN